MHTRFLTMLFLGAAMLAACGGGGSSNPAPVTPPAPVVPATAAPPAAHPTTAPPVAPPTMAPPASQGNVPVSETVAGAAAFVDPASHHTLYFLDSDTATGGTCTGGCLSIWPPLAPTPGSVAGGGLTIITRSDGKGQQWAYQGHPLYMFSGDSGPDQANGDNFPQPPGHWHVARPAGVAVAPTMAPVAPTAAPVAPTAAPATPPPSGY